MENKIFIHSLVIFSHRIQKKALNLNISFRDTEKKMNAFLTWIIVTAFWVGVAFLGMAYSRKKEDPQLWMTLG